MGSARMLLMMQAKRLFTGRVKEKNGNAQTYSRDLAYCSLQPGASETRFNIVHKANAIANL